MSAGGCTPLSVVPSMMRTSLTNLCVLTSRRSETASIKAVMSKACVLLNAMHSLQVTRGSGLQCFVSCKSFVICVAWRFTTCFTVVLMYSGLALMLSSTAEIRNLCPSSNFFAATSHQLGGDDLLLRSSPMQYCSGS